MSSGTATRVRVGPRELRLSNLDKPYWPEEGIRKGDFLSYCTRVAPVLIPHLRDRPLVMTRYPDGVGGKSFYQKDAPEHVPPWVRLYPYWSEDSGRWLRFIVCDEPATLLWVANQGTLELHPWLSAVAGVERPDFAVVDLDPAEGVGYREAVEVALLLRQLLRALGLRGYAKTTGATGVHVYVPLERRYDYAATAGFVRRLGVVLRRHAPELVTLERRVHKRTGRVYVDYLQNVLGKTLVSAYSPRPRAGAPVSFPVAWEDLPHVAPGDFTIATAPPRLDRRGDTFAPVLRDRQRLEGALRRLDALTPAAGEREES